MNGIFMDPHHQNGCRGQTIAHFSPKLMVSLYHRNEDIFALPLLIRRLNPGYDLYIRHQLYIPAWETNLYAVPSQKNSLA